MDPEPLDSIVTSDLSRPPGMPNIGSPWQVDFRCWALTGEGVPVRIAVREDTASWREWQRRLAELSPPSTRPAPLPLPPGPLSAWPPIHAPAPVVGPPPRFLDEQRPMRMCKHFVTAGFCRQGDTCAFAHVSPELPPQVGPTQHCAIWRPSATTVHPPSPSEAAVDRAPRAAADRGGPYDTRGITSRCGLERGAPQVGLGGSAPPGGLGGCARCPTMREESVKAAAAMPQWILGLACTGSHSQLL